MSSSPARARRPLSPARRGAAVWGLLLAGCSTTAAPKVATPALEAETTDADADADADGTTDDGSGDGGSGDGGSDGSGDDSPAPCRPEDGGRLAAPEGAFLAQDAPLTGVRDRCAGLLHATAGAAGSTLTLGLDAWSADTPAWVTVTALDGTVLLDTTLAAGEHATVVPPRSGELLVRLDPEDPDAAAHDYGLSVTCTADCRPFTRHPIVLMHGMAGDDAWVGVFDYFVGVEADLDDLGVLAVAPGVDAFNTVASRAAQWSAHLDQLEADGIGRRFNLIGHSQGGLDARYLVGAMGEDRVVSVTTVATPHHGTAVADIATGALDATALGSWATDAVASLLATILGLGEAELTGQLRDLSSAQMATFNEEVPDVAGLPYWSWAGRTCTRTDWGCLADNDGEITNAFFALTTRVMTWAEGDNDGLVGVESAHWGEFLGVVPADHIDSVGIHDPTATAPFDHKAFYRDEAARLAAEGL